jgi:hypothetical protein
LFTSTPDPFSLRRKGEGDEVLGRTKVKEKSEPPKNTDFFLYSLSIFVIFCYVKKRDPVLADKLYFWIVN